MADTPGTFEDPAAVIKETLGGGTTGTSPGAPGSSSTPTGPVAAPTLQPPTPTPPGAPQALSSEPAKPPEPFWGKTMDTWKGDMSGSFDALKDDLLKSANMDPESKQAFQSGTFWDQMKAEYHGFLAAGKLPLDAFGAALSPIMGGVDAATGVAAHAAFKVLPAGSAAWGTDEAGLHTTLNTALGLLAPEKGASAVQTAVVSGRASADGSIGESIGKGPPDGGASTAPRLNAAGTPADASTVTFRAKPNGTSSDAWRNVATMDKGDVQRFYDQANSYAGKTAEDLDVTEDKAPELYQGIGQFTISGFKAPADVPLFMRAALDNIPAQMRPMSDVDLAAQVKAGAAAIGVDRDTMTGFMRNIATETSKLPQAVGIMRASYQGITTQLSKDALAGLGDYSDADLETARGHMEGTAETGLDLAGDPGRELANKITNVQTALNWAASLSDTGTGLGRGLRAMQLPGVDLDGVMNTLKMFNGDPAPVVPGGAKPPQTLMDLDRFYRLYNAAGDDPISRMNLLTGRSIVPTPGWYLRSSFANAYTGSLLAGKAIIKGYLLPAFMGALQTFERTSAAGLASINPFLSAADRATFGSIAKASVMSYFQTMGDFASAFRYSIMATKNGGRSIIRGGGSTAYQDAGRMGPISQEMLDAAKGGPSGTPDWRYQLGNLINVWPRAVFSLVGGHDELTNRLSYMGRINMTAQVAAQRAGVTDPNELLQYMNGARADAIDPSGAATHPDILNEAARTSFMNTTSTSPMASTIQAINSARNSVPELRYILPVLNVPANALGEGVRRLPGVNLMFEQTRRELSGEAGQIAQAEAYGRMMSGAALLGTGYGLARSAILTGGGPSNPADKAQWENNGYQPYSFKIAGKWFSYKNVPVLGSILGLVANMTDRTVHYAEDDQNHSAVLATISGLAEYSKDQASMQAVSNLLSMGDPEQNPDKFWTRLLGGTASGFEPAFVKYIRNDIDPELRSKDSIWDYINDGLPSRSLALPPVRNTFGEPIHTPNDASNLYGLMPWTISAANADHKDPVADELDKVYQLTGYAGGVTHPAELSKGHFDPQALRLEDGQTMFDKFAQNRMVPYSLPQDDGDPQNVRSRLVDLFASDDYKAATYGSPSKKNLVGDDDAANEGVGSKLNMIQRVFTAADTSSKQRLAQDSPIAKRYMAVTNAKTDRPDLLRGYKADDLVKNPPLLKSLGIDINQYEDKVSGQ